MNTIGIICEYNPFHNGHLYHINKIKEKYPDSILVLALNGYFMERGEVSVISKYDKTKLALKYGVDLVLELPVLYGTNSADIFAHYSVKALNEARCTKIIFGSESNNIDVLKKLAENLESEEVNIKVKEELAKGNNYPTSLAKALGAELKSNDILGVTYIKAINKINPNIEPETIQRTNDFLDTSSNENIVSAQNIRLKLEKGEDITKYIPDYSTDYIRQVNDKKIFEILKHKIITENDLSRFLGIDEGLDARLKGIIFQSHSYDELVENLKTKRFTTSRIKRLLIHILLGITKKDILLDTNEFRILGFSKNGQKYLKDLENEKLIYKTKGRVRELDVIASFVYDEITNDNTIDKEISNKPIMEEENE